MSLCVGKVGSFLLAWKWSVIETREVRFYELMSCFLEGFLTPSSTPKGCAGENGVGGVQSTQYSPVPLPQEDSD